MATLAHNLDVRRDGVHERFPSMTIYWIGNSDHQARQSDHNPDSRGIVHAIDCMITTVAQGNEIVAWALTDTRDLQYVIFNRTIWSRSSGFKPQAYTGDNPHVDHVHISGKHGSVGENAATGTGYDVVAEQMSPEGMMDMTPAQQYVQHVMNYRIDAILHMRPTCNVPAFTATDGSRFPAITETNHLALAVLAADDTGDPAGPPIDLNALAEQIAADVVEKVDVPTVDEIADEISDREAAAARAEALAYDASKEM